MVAWHAVTEARASQDSSRSLPLIIQKIKKIDQVQDAFIGFAGVESENYRNFQRLVAVASPTQLLALTDDENGVLACYASWGLIDLAYENLQQANDLPAIFVKFLAHDRNVSTFSGCIVMDANLSSEFYHRCWGQTVENELARSQDKTLMVLDSMILYNEDADWLLTVRALGNRQYPAAYLPRIAQLAFDQVNRDAIDYLYRWHARAYAARLKQAMCDDLQQTTYSNVGITAYYDRVEKLLQYQDPAVKAIVRKKLEKDRHWEYDRDLFETMLAQSGITLPQQK
jgi:hypothetical protein